MNNRMKNLMRFLKNRDFHPIAESDQDIKRIYSEMLVVLRLIARELGLPLGSYVVYGGMHHRCAVLKACGLEVKAYLSNGKLFFGVQNRYAKGVLPAERLVDFEAFIDTLLTFVPYPSDSERRAS